MPYSFKPDRMTTCTLRWRTGPSPVPNGKNPVSADSKPRVHIRPAQPSDMLAIRALIRRYPEKLVQQDLPRAPSFFAAFVRGRLIGCCALQVYSRRLAEVRSLAVDEEFQKQGIAGKLVARCLDHARQRGVKQILAVSGDPDFFRQSGFETFFREKTALFYNVPRK